MSKEFLSKRILAIEPSLTLQISAKAKELAANGKDICNLSAGEPDFEAPKEVIKATSNAIFNGFTKYGPAAGDLELRKAIANKLNVKNKIEIDFENILITNGAKQAIYNLFQVLLDDGDEVIIPSPYWLSYPEMVKLAGGKPVFLQTFAENGFKIEKQNLTSKINARTKFIIINSPNNPTGKVLNEEELNIIAEVLRENKNINLISDEIYELILKKNFQHISFAAFAKDLKDRIFTINGFAKGWAMTGWRLGYLVGEKEVIKACSTLQSQSTSNVCSFAQRGALAALGIKKEFFDEINLKFDERREILFQGLKKIKGIYIKPPNGAFYAFPKLPNKKISSVDFCKRVLEDYGLVVVPGKVFGDDQFIRISCASSNEMILDGLSRFENAIKYYY
tara:strand:- start:2730 stop:3908 length:1179 start_codon:yes stop_codon:yes gene_type:complete